MTGVGPGLLLFVVAVVLAVAQRSTLARALRVPDSQPPPPPAPDRRRPRRDLRRLLRHLQPVIGDTWTVRETVLAIIGTLAMFGAVGSSSPDSSPPARARPRDIATTLG